MKNQILFIFLLALLLAFSCIPAPLEIDVPEAEPKIIISSQFLVDSGVAVSCMRTFSALSDNYMPEKINIDFINKAFGLHSLVLLEHNNIIDTLYNMGMGLYFNGSVKVNVGDICYLTVHDSVLDEEEGLSVSSNVNSNAVFLQSINFDTIYVKLDVKNNDTSAIVYFKITDPIGKNYYLINNYIYKESQNSIDYTSFFGDNPYAELLQEYINQSEFGNMISRFTNIGNVENQVKLLNDSIFENLTYSDSVKFYHVSTNDTLAVSVGNISKDYYDYLVLRLKASTIYSQIMSDPINMPTNVKGGYGMFTTHSLNIWLFDLSKNEIIR